MSAQMLDAVSIGPASRYTDDKLEASLAASTDELARLRFAIILTARWETSDSEDAEHRAELRTELLQLRGLYFDKIDEMAMAFGVQKAMNAKEEVESAVIVPRGMTLPMTPDEAGDMYY